MKDDLISRQAAIEYFMTNTNWHDEDGYEIHDAEDKRALLKSYFDGILSVQPEVKPIDDRDCSCALLKMWIENVLTDSEYSRIQGKLNSSDFAKEGLRVPVPYQEGQDG